MYSANPKFANGFPPHTSIWIEKMSIGRATSNKVMLQIFSLLALVIILFFVSIKYWHFIWQVNSQFYQSCNITFFVIPWCLMQKFMLAMTYNLIGIAFVRFVPQ